MGRITAQPLNRFDFCVVVVEFAVNGNQALSLCFDSKLVVVVAEVGFMETRLKSFHSLLHHLHSSITKWSVRKSTDLLFLFVI